MAELKKQFLENEGIEVQILNGVKLYVSEKDFNRAKELLKLSMKTRNYTFLIEHNRAMFMLIIFSFFGSVTFMHFSNMLYAIGFFIGLAILGFFIGKEWCYYECSDNSCRYPMNDIYASECRKCGRKILKILKSRNDILDAEEELFPDSKDGTD